MWLLARVKAGRRSRAARGRRPVEATAHPEAKLRVPYWYAERDASADKAMVLLQPLREKEFNFSKISPTEIILKSVDLDGNLFDVALQTGAPIQRSTRQISVRDKPGWLQCGVYKQQDQRCVPPKFSHH